MTKKYVISAGHGKYVSGANGYIKEHESAVRVVNRVHEILTKNYKGSGYKYIESTANNQNSNLSNIVKYHNSKDRSLDVSIHFNSASPQATGSEVCYFDLKSLSAKLSKAMSKAMHIPDRGAKERKELYFLRNTTQKAILLEVCFVTSKKDTKEFNNNFELLCQSIAYELAEYLGYTKVKSKTHKVVSGDTLWSIAKVNHMTISSLLKKNPKIKSNDVLKIGTIINL